MDGWKDGTMERYMDGWVNEWVDGWMTAGNDRRNSTFVYLYVQGSGWACKVYSAISLALSLKFRDHWGSQVRALMSSQHNS